jgi:alkane 1-monooxygenase
MEDRLDQIHGGEGPRPLAFFSIYLVTAIGLYFTQRGGWYTLISPLAMTFVAVPVFDILIGLDPRNPRETPPGWLAHLIYRLANWMAVPVQAVLLWWGAWYVTRPAATPLEVAGIGVAVGITGGVIGITVAHELIHRSSRVDRILGGVLLALVSYLHWAIEHVAGHHRRVATPEDPATARLDEPLLAFMLRSAGTGFLSAWRIEAARNGRRGIRSPFANRVLWGGVTSLVLGAAFGAVFGPRGLVFFFLQSVVAIVFLETINYIEHYGLERRLIGPGVYERVTPRHSWNAAHRLTNALLFNLQRHSDHHVWPARPYFKLRHHPESPQLPTGYAGMALLAMVPPVWRRVMNPRVAAHRAAVAEAAATSAEDDTGAVT